MPPILISLTSFGAAETRRHGQLWVTYLAHAAGVQGVEVREELLVNPDAEIPLIAAAVLAGLGQPEPWRGDAGLRRAWLAETVYQALATVVWATDVGDEPFAQVGREMLDRALAS